MQESLYDRFRPFKPYDLVLIETLVVLVAVSSAGSLLLQLALLVGGLSLFLLLDLLQKLVRVPTPAWQALAIVAGQTATLALLAHYGANQFSLELFILNVACATLAFGEQIGIATAVQSVLAPYQLLFLTAGTQAAYPPLAQSGLVLAVLLTVVAILSRISQLQYQAVFDAVTGLRNHGTFQVRLREELYRSERQQGSTALLLLDLDNFKKVNDQFGHVVGDRVLRQVADALARNVRTADIVCRYGGEEIAVILPDTSTATAAAVAERLRLAVAQAATPDTPAVTVSIGVAALPEHASQSDMLIAAADAAMYLAKRGGKNRVQTAAPVRDVTSTP